MSRIERSLRHIVADLTDLACPFALIGGFAVSARTEPRTTKDVDVAIDVPGDQEAEQLTFGLSQRGYRPDMTIEQKSTNRLATVRFTSPSGSIVDLLFASSGIEPEIVRDAEVLEILEGVLVPVASVAHLIAMKVLARNDRTRPQDRVDLAALLRVASPKDVTTARGALDLVTERGAARGRALVQELERAVVELGPDAPL